MKYEVYQTGKLPPLTVVEADGYYFAMDKQKIEFFLNDHLVAMFNWNNIAGFKKLTEDESDEEGVARVSDLLDAMKRMGESLNKLHDESECEE